MDTEALRAFCAVAESGSFSQTAEALHLTQPAISKRIATLEARLGAQLFDRVGRGMRLTEAGRSLLPRAQRVLQELSDARRAIDDLAGEVSGTLSMGISHHIGLHRLPPVLRRYTAGFPDVRLDINFMDSEQAHASILQGRLDLAVITLAPIDEPQLQSFLVWPDPLCIAVARNHPLAANTSVTLQELSEHTAIPPGLNTYTGQIIAGLFRDAGLSMDIGMATNYMETIKVMVDVGLGWSVLPRSLMDASLHELKIEGVDLQRQLGCLFHRERSMSNAAKAFVAALRQEAETTPAVRGARL